MQKHGTPVGAVVLPGPCIESFHRECQMVFPEIKNLQFRGVEPATNKTNGYACKTCKTIHLQTEVVASILDGDAPSLVEFIHRNDGQFLPGVRKRRDTRHSEARTPREGISARPPPGKFTFVELFAGVGGFRLGLEPIGGSCVLASERDEVACAFYRRHFGTHRSDAGDNPCPELVEGDVIDIVSEDFPEGGFDLLTAGFPCQPFSARGKKKGLDDDGHRGQMYQELVRILAEEQPSYFLFENVVGLVTMDGGRRVVCESSSSDRNEHFFESGRTMETVVNAFRSCGYKVEWHVVNCKHFCPQHRERVYFFGSRSELDCPDLNWDGIYPSEAPTRLLRDFLERDHADCPDVRGCELSERQWEMVRRKCEAQGEEPALSRLGLKIHEPSAPTLISSYRTPASLSARFVTEEADGTLRDGRPLRPRFLTPAEFRRIMGFPDTFEVTAPPRVGDAKNRNDVDEGFVDGHAYKVLGNAVVPAVVEAIGREILRLMEEVNARPERGTKN